MFTDKKVLADIQALKNEVFAQAQIIRNLLEYFHLESVPQIVKRDEKDNPVYVYYIRCKDHDKRPVTLDDLQNDKLKIDLILKHLGVKVVSSAEQFVPAKLELLIPEDTNGSTVPVLCRVRSKRKPDNSV